LESDVRAALGGLDTVIVTRHRGAVEWLAAKGISGQIIEHADPEDVRGKHVIGNLPLYLAALADRVSVIDMPNLTPEQRGKDLTPAEMDSSGAVLVCYQVRLCEP
jgi:CRISPR-associated protein Csx16